MSEFLAIDRRLYGEAPTVEGRLADILAEPDCIVEVDEYKLTSEDKSRVVMALRLAALVAEIAHSYKPALKTAQGEPK